MEDVLDLLYEDQQEAKYSLPQSLGIEKNEKMIKKRLQRNTAH
jgi:hypothetical protein